MAADSGRLREACAPAHTRSGRSPSDTSYRVGKRSSDRSSARRPCPQVPQGHPRVAKGASGRSSARRPCPQVLQRHLVVARGSFGRSLARRPCPQVPQGHPRGLNKRSADGQQRSADATSGQRTFSQRMPAAVGKQSSSFRPGEVRGHSDRGRTRAVRQRPCAVRQRPGAGWQTRHKMARCCQTTEYG